MINAKSYTATIKQPSFQCQKTTVSIVDMNPINSTITRSLSLPVTVTPQYIICLNTFKLADGFTCGLFAVKLTCSNNPAPVPSSLAPKLTTLELQFQKHTQQSLNSSLGIEEFLNTTRQDNCVDEFTETLYISIEKVKPEARDTLVDNFRNLFNDDGYEVNTHQNTLLTKQTLTVPDNNNRQEIKKIIEEAEKKHSNR